MFLKRLFSFSFFGLLDNPPQKTTLTVYRVTGTRKGTGLENKHFSKWQIVGGMGEKINPTTNSPHLTLSGSLSLQGGMGMLLGRINGEERAEPPKELFSTKPSGSL